MKKAKFIIFVALFIIGLAAFSSCNKKLCPAYAQSDTEEVQDKDS